MSSAWGRPAACTSSSASPPSVGRGHRVTEAGPEALLAGLRVVDLAGEPAAMTGRILADLGAEVIKVEPPGGDPLRSVPPLGPDGTSLRFAAWNAGKAYLEATGPDDPRLAELLGAADLVLSTPGWPGALEVEPAR